MLKTLLFCIRIYSFHALHLLVFIFTTTINGNDLTTPDDTNIHQLATISISYVPCHNITAEKKISGNWQVRVAKSHYHMSHDWTRKELFDLFVTRERSQFDRFHNGGFHRVAMHLILSHTPFPVQWIAICLCCLFMSTFSCHLDGPWREQTRAY